MVYEVEAFCEACLGERDFLPYLDLTEKVQLLVDKIYAETGATKYF